jgi:16S rRNA processing protein RimM
MSELRLIAVGRISRPHGVRGAVKMHSYGDTLASRATGDVLHLCSSDGKPEAALTLASIEWKGGCWITRFSEVDDRDAAQALAGREVFVPEALIPPLEEGEYYHYQLIGLTVWTKAGIKVGEILGVLEAGGGDVYVVNGERGEALIPAVEEIVVEVDLAQRRMVVDPPEGLIDGL